MDIRTNNVNIKQRGSILQLVLANDANRLKGDSVLLNAMAESLIKAWWVFIILSRLLQIWRNFKLNSWATPDDHAIQILWHFSPIVDISVDVANQIQPAKGISAWSRQLWEPPPLCSFLLRLCAIPVSSSFTCCCAVCVWCLLVFGLSCCHCHSSFLCCFVVVLVACFSNQSSQSKSRLRWNRFLLLKQKCFSVEICSSRFTEVH